MTFVGQISLFLGYYNDDTGRGIITSIVTGSAIVSALSAYIFYKEKLSCSMIVGIIMSTVGIVMITLQSGTDGTLIGVVGGFGALIGFSCKNVTSRTVELQGLDSHTNGILNAIFEGLCGVIFVTILHFANYEPFETDINMFVALLGGFLIAIGAYYLNEAIMCGYVGPPASIANMTGAAIVFLDYLFFNIVPDNIKALGMTIAILGAVVILLADLLLVKMGCNVCVPPEIVKQFTSDSKLNEPLIEKKE
jgi:drug/metabolite transporter (DMT)-like permease